MAYTFVVVWLFIEYQSKRFVYHNSSWAVKVEFINCDWARVVAGTATDKWTAKDNICIIYLYIYSIKCDLYILYIYSWSPFYLHDRASQLLSARHNFSFLQLLFSAATAATLRKLAHEWWWEGETESKRENCARVAGCNLHIYEEAGKLQDKRHRFKLLQIEKRVQGEKIQMQMVSANGRGGAKGRQRRVAAVQGGTV